MASIDPFGLQALRFSKSPEHWSTQRRSETTRLVLEVPGGLPLTNEYIGESSTTNGERVTNYARSPRPSGSSCLVLRPCPRGPESAGVKLSAIEPFYACFAQPLVL